MASLPTSTAVGARTDSAHGALFTSPLFTLPKHQGLIPTLTIVVPTRNEAGNISPLVARLEQALANIPYELIFVDDSDDDTPAVIQSLQDQGHPGLTLVHRLPGQRKDGLGGAVLIGLEQARAPLVCMMDGDLQHPPELVPRLLEKILAEQADLVIGSRYQEGGDAGGLNFVRLGISQSLDTLARLIFQKQLANVSDPMTGFFLVRKNKIDIEKLHPRGFKILLEILVRTPDLRVTDVPFAFGTRSSGESKADLREGLRYFSQVIQLYVGEDALRFFRFCLIGLSGIVINLFLTFFFTDLLELHYLGAAVIATQGSSLWNFILTESWVFQGRQPRWNRLYRLVMFLLVNNAALAVRGPIIFTLTTGMGVHYLLSNLFSILALTLFRYMVADVWIWKKERGHEIYTPVVNRAT